MEETIEIERHPSVYIFDLSKVESFKQALLSIPQEEIGQVNFWNATKQHQLIFEFGDNKLYEYHQVWCLSVDFKPEHSQLKQLAEQESLFYAKDDVDNRYLINQFFGSQEKDLGYYEYLNSIGK